MHRSKQQRRRLNKRKPSSRPFSPSDCTPKKFKLIEEVVSSLERNSDTCYRCDKRGTLICCDGCEAAYHPGCLGLNMKYISNGDWFCPLCCGKNGDQVEDESITATCAQCMRKCHLNPCMGTLHSPRLFCDMHCQKVFNILQQLVGKPFQIDLHNVTLTILVRIPNAKKHGKKKIHSMLNAAYGVMKDSFLPCVDPITEDDIIKSVIFNKGASTYRGFYTITLEKCGEVISAAVVRVGGKKIAEMPFVCTNSKYRGQGYCGILMKHLESELRELGVERLVLPSAPAKLDMWINKYGFSEMEEEEILEFSTSGYAFLEFEDAVMCGKKLSGHEIER